MSNYIKIFLSGLFHETHTFLDKLTRLEAFHVKHGKTIRDCQGDSSPIGGILELLAQNKVEVVLGTDYRAAPSGIVEDAVLESFWQDLENAWDPDVDGVFLVLHGAMVTESHKDVEGEILQRIRKLPEASKLPVFGVYDLHANFTPVMAKFANGLIAYRENPHTDARESAVRAASLMLSCLQNGEVPSMVYRSTGLVWEPTATGTADVPMASLEELARKLEEENDSVLAANINGGFAYANFVPLIQLQSTCDLASINRGAVAAAQVFHPALSVLQPYLCMHPADGGIRAQIDAHGHLVVGAPDHHGISAESLDAPFALILVADLH